MNHDPQYTAEIFNLQVNESFHVSQNAITAFGKNPDLNESLLLEYILNSVNCALTVPVK